MNADADWIVIGDWSPPVLNGRATPCSQARRSSGALRET
jgi:hypothetical protein